MEKKAQIISRILFCLYVTAVILLCIIKTESLPELPKTFLGIPLDKIAHFIMFLPFPILSYATFCHKDSSIWRDLALMAIICITGGVFAYSTEILQSMTDYRSSDIMDIAADGAGLLSGTLATIIYILFRK
jgi:VanZ family protein